MNKIITFLLLPLLMIMSISTFGQISEPHCGTDEFLHKMYEKDPDLIKRMAKSFEKSNVAKSDTIDTNLLIIPVVFHVLHQYGVENITDAQIYDQMRIMNEDYRLKNADRVQVVSAFDTVMADAHIEFRLATIDPAGNPTNGIEHIYSHEINIGDENSKLNQWHRSMYLNVWTNKAFPPSNDGTVLQGYSMFPESVNGNNFYQDGIIFTHNTIGTIGTADGDGRVLTHEAGHWLNLAHPWGGTNSPNVACGDDAVDDTPETKGGFDCTLNKSICNVPIIENVQNYMDYSHCSKMFTKGQTVRLREALRSDVANRSNLITPANAALTGVYNVAVCKPKADFFASSKFVCLGSSVTFKDVSWRAAVDSRVWTFEGGTPSTSTTVNQIVTYNTPGYKKVTLSVQNENGVDELVQENYIYVSPNWADFTGPYSNNLEAGTANWFLNENPDSDYSHFELINSKGYDNSRCFKLNNYKDITQAIEYSPDWFHNKRLGGSRDALITPSYDLSNTSNVSISFKYAYATNATVSADITEYIKVYTSKNCGETWTLRYTLRGPMTGTVPSNTSTQLVTAGYAGFTEFVPQTNDKWKTCSFNYTASAQDEQTRVKIEFIASDLSSNLYIDDINVSGTLGLFSNEIENLELSVFPNPVSSDQSITVSYKAGENPVELILRDVQGKVIYNKTISTTNSEVTHTLELGAALSSTCYFLEVKSGDFSTVKKVVVL